LPDALSEQTCIILCEGEGDKAFFRHLIEHRKLPLFAIITPNPPEPGGRPGYQARLRSLRVESRQFENVRGVLVVSDNDDSLVKSFNEVVGHIDQAEGYGVPQKPLQIVQPRQADHPLLAVMMIPWTKTTGNLESLCLISMYHHYPEVKKCLEAFCHCLKLKAWRKGQLSKMKFRAMVAAICKSDPNTGLQYAWSRKEKLVPLEHKCFDRIANFLKKFSRSAEARGRT
jgi:Protein of unknown function (DUF3226)